VFFFFFQAEDGIRDLVRSRGLGDVYKRQVYHRSELLAETQSIYRFRVARVISNARLAAPGTKCVFEQTARPTRLVFFRALA